jgi:outer membrane biosynthesis protein TonB
MRIKASSSIVWSAVILATVALLAGCSHTVRTDAQVASDVQSKIFSDAAVQSRDIAVQAANGVVTLDGTVTSDAERGAVANDAGAVNGVKTVINNLQVQQAQVAPPPAEQPQPAPTPAKKKKPVRHHKHDDQSNNDLQAQAAPPEMPEQPQPAPAPPQKITVPPGTQLSVRLNDTLDSEKNQVGDTFHGSLSTPIVINGETVIPSGADVVGRVAAVQSAGRFAGQSVLTLELTSVAVNGKTYNVQTNQWTRSGKGEGKNTATKVGVGTVAGAVLGGLIGGGKGAAIGAASGAGAGTGVAAAKKGQQIKLAPEAVLNFQTINTLVVIPQNNDNRNAGRAPLS